MFNQMRGDPIALQENAEALIQLAGEKDLRGWLGMATSCRGEALVMRGQIHEAIALIREGMAISEATSVELYKPVILRSLAKAQVNTGDLQEGLTTLEKALAVVERTGERHWEADYHRLRGELLDLLGDSVGAESGFTTAIEISRSQKAKSWELRAAIDLARLWQKQGKVDEARDLLEPVYGWFTEGYDTLDLKEAEELLQELS
jgi:predicted ATPase